MMYPNFTLYPGGAFMLCESIGDIPYTPDDEIPSVENNEPVAVMPTSAPVSIAPEDTPEQYGDPVTKLLLKMKPFYQEQIHPLMELHVEYGDVQNAINTLERVSDTASNMVQKIQIQMGKLCGILDTWKGIREGENTFYSYLGIFMKNAARIRQEGMDTYEYSFDAISELYDSWDCERVIQIFKKNPEILDRMITNSMISLPHGDNTVSSRFDGFVDFLECIFNYEERFHRIEKSYNLKLRFNDMLAMVGEGQICNAGPSHNVSLTILMSMILRRTKMELYDMECAIVDGSMDERSFNSRLTPILMRIVNTFALGMLELTNKAYTLRAMQCGNDAAAQYTKQLLNLLKAG